MLQILLNHSQMPCKNKPVLFLHEDHYTTGLDISDTTRDREIKGHLVITETILFSTEIKSCMCQPTGAQRHRGTKS